MKKTVYKSRSRHQQIHCRGDPEIPEVESVPLQSSPLQAKLRVREIIKSREKFDFFNE